MDGIQAFARRHGLFVIEDNAEAYGGSYKGTKTGTLGDVAACSFCQNKTFTTGGEGSMKPLGMTVAEAEEMSAAAARLGLRLGTALMMRFMPSIGRRAI